MDKEELHHLLQKYRDGTLTQEEKRLWDDVLDSYDGDGSPGIELEVDDSIGAGIYQELREEIKKREPLVSSPKRSWQWAKVAASIVLLIGLGYLTYFFTSGNNEAQEVQVKLLSKTTDWGQRSNITLADGTKIALNAGSTLEFPESFTHDSIRRVRLKGEAFFEVVPNVDQPFVVVTDNIYTRVLGTSFNISSYPFNEDISVTVKTGKVQVSDFEEEDAQTVYLVPNEEVQYHREKKEMVKQKADGDSYLDWKKGVIRIQDKTIGETSKILSRWYGVQFEVGSTVQDCHLTGTYENVRLQAVLESMKSAIKGLDYEFANEGRVILKGSCKD